MVLADGIGIPGPRPHRLHRILPSTRRPARSSCARRFANPKGVLRPGQFVRARVSGAVRPNAILVPQRAVLQGSKSHFVWVVDKDSKAHQRVVEVGEWHGDDWFVNDGLKPGERIVVDGAIRVIAATQPLKIVQAPAEPGAGRAGRAGFGGPRRAVRTDTTPCPHPVRAAAN